MITSAEILERIGLKSSKTLTRWHQQGLIPPPTIKPHPDGRGRTAYWEEWVVDTCIRIKQLLASGHSLDEIASLLADEKSQKRTFKRRYEFAEVAKLLDYRAAVEQFREAAWHKLINVINQGAKRVPGTLRNVDLQLTTPRIVERLIDLLQHKVNVMLVFDGENLDVIADFQITEQLSQGASTGQALIVIPIFEEALAAFSPVYPNLPRKPDVFPSNLVFQRGQKENPYKYKTTSDGEFRFVKLI